MLKIIIFLTLVVLGALFCVENSEHVPVGLIFGGPTRIRLIFLLLIAAGIGFVLAYLLSLVREIRLRKEIRRLSMLNRAALARLGAETREPSALQEPSR
jgi:uncharacterized integral membrane protein